MDSILDLIPNLLPAIFIIMALRRIVGGIRKRQAAGKSGNKNKAASTQQIQSKGQKTRSRESVIDKIANFARTSVVQRPVQQKELRKKTAVPVAPPAQEPVQTLSTLQGLRSSSYKTPRQKKASGALRRIDKLPPLARGMVWSFILERPPGFDERGS